MQGSRTGLEASYVSEPLVHEAGKAGLRDSVIRSGYVLDDSKTGVCNTNDFLICMLKSCIQLSVWPRTINTVNSVPTNHVTCVVVAAAINLFQVAYTLLATRA